MTVSNLILPGTGPMGYDLTDETVALVRRSREADSEMNRAITTSTGLVGYDLAAPAAVVVPVTTPVVNSTPRVKGPGIDIHHWKAITSLGWNTITGVTDEGASASEVTYTVLNFANLFQTISAGNSVTFQAQWRGRSLEGDVKAKRTAELIYAIKLIEEQWLITYSDYLWAPATPLAPSTAATGGTIAANTYYVSVSAYNANGETFATGAAATVVTTGSTSTITCTAFTVPNATGYHVYVGTSAGTQYRQPAGNYSTSAEPTQPANTMLGNFSFTLTALTLSGTQLPVANSAVLAKQAAAPHNPLTFNGVLALIFGAGNQAYASINGAPTAAFSAAGQSTSGLSSLGLNTETPIVVQPAASNGKLAYTDITGLLQNMFLNARANPDYMAVSPVDNQTVTNLLANATGTRVVVNADLPDQQGMLTLGTRVSQVLNPTTGKMIQVEVWPYLPQGTIILGSRTLPYPVAGFDGPVMKIIVNQDYWGIDFPPTQASQRYSFANYVEETLEVSFLGGFGAITGIIPS